MFYTLFNRIISKKSYSLFRINSIILRRHILNATVTSATHDIPVKLAFNEFNPRVGLSDKPPIIFVHGLTLSKENWKDIPQAAADATKRKAFSLDMRNHGESEWRRGESYDCERMVEDLLHSMDSMEIERAILVAHSIGGVVSIKTALRKPERIEKLVVEDQYVRKVPKSRVFSTCIHLAKSALLHVPLGADKKTAEEFIIDFIFKNLPADLTTKVTRKDWSYLQLKRTENNRYSFQFNIDAVEDMVNNITEAMSENKGIYTGPASFIYGGLSPYRVGEEKEHIRKFFPNAQFVEIANATHQVHSDCPDVFTEALIEFLSKE